MSESGFDREETNVGPVHKLAFFITSYLGTEKGLFLLPKDPRELVGLGPDAPFDVLIDDTLYVIERSYWPPIRERRVNISKEVGIKTEAIRKGSQRLRGKGMTFEEIRDGITGYFEEEAQTEPEVAASGEEPENDGFYEKLRDGVAGLQDAVAKRRVGQPIPGGAVERLVPEKESREPKPKVPTAKGLQASLLNDWKVKVDVSGLRVLEIPRYIPDEKFMDSIPARYRKLIRSLSDGTLDSSIGSAVLRRCLNSEDPDSDAARTNLSIALKKLDSTLGDQQEQVIVKLRDGKAEASYFFCSLPLIRASFPPNIREGLFAR